MNPGKPPPPQPGEVIRYAYLWASEATWRRLGLQEERCWILVSEVNRFFWPGTDLRPVEQPSGAFYRYGLLPASLFMQLKSAFLEQVRAKKLRAVPRPE